MRLYLKLDCLSVYCLPIKRNFNTLITIKSFLFIILVLNLSIQKSYGQHTDSSLNLSPEGRLENVYDRFGRKFSLSEIQVTTASNVYSRSTSNGVTTLMCSSGMFDLYFDTGSGMENTGIASHNARRAIVCQVFQDLSDFINSPLKNPGNTKRVNIWIRNIDQILPANLLPSSTSGVGGVASGFYNIPTDQNVTNGAILDTEIWKTIHTGNDSFTNVAFPMITYGNSQSTSGPFFHGYLSINFNNPNTIWNTDLNVFDSATGLTGKIDLYTTVLHEVLHALGFNSLMEVSGYSIFTAPLRHYYSRYDTFLAKQDNTKLILNNPTSQGYMYGFNFNGVASDLYPGCGEPTHLNETGLPINHTILASAIKFKSSVVDVPVYTPYCFEKGSSLSHFEDEGFQGNSNDQYFVMCNQSSSLVAKRFLKPEERLALCDIGYETQTTYGTIGTSTWQEYSPNQICDGITVGGINDGLTGTGSNTVYDYQGNSGTPIQINGFVSGSLSGILANDYTSTGSSNLRFEKLQDVYDPNAIISSSLGDSTTIITLTTYVPGVHLLRYVPYDNINGDRGNVTYVYVNVLNNCQGNGSGTSNSCNLVKNGQFEEHQFPPTTSSQPYYSCGWQNASYIPTADYFASNSTSPSQSVPCNAWGYQQDNVPGNGAYMGMFISNASFYSYLLEGTYSESIKTELTNNLQSNQQYQLSFDVSLSEVYSSRSLKFQALLSDYEFPINTGGIIPTSMLNSNSLLFTNSNFSNTSSAAADGWERITFTFSTGATAGQKYLYIGGLQNVQMQPESSLALPSCPGMFANQNGFSYYFIDNVSLVPISNNNTLLNLPTYVCNTASPIILNSAVTPTTTGVFSGDGVTLNGSNYLFDPVVAGLGAHTISFTYLYYGCPVTITDIITVSNVVVTPTFNQVLPVCSGSLLPALPTTSLNGITGSWSPTISNTVTTNYTFTPDSNQCATFTNMTIQVNPLVVPNFNIVTSICSGDPLPQFPTTSINNIQGSWSQTSINTYVFTPNSNQCATTKTITITVRPKITPNFNPVPSVCVGGYISSLPTTSLNGITGSWTPAIDNLHTTTYTFHPDSGQCITTDVVTITINVNPTDAVPIFNLPNSVCSGMNAPLLPLHSLNGISGSWSPSIISTSQSGTYVFTPGLNQCALATSVYINVISNCSISLTSGSEVSCQLTTDPRGDADIVDGPCIRVCENSTITYTLAGGTGAISSTVWSVSGGTIDSSSNTTCTITWGTASYSVLEGLITLYDGTTLEIHKCIEKLTPPSASFSIFLGPNSNVDNLNFIECVNNPIHFENLTTNNGGNGVLYYNWNFGDGFTSNEYEPSHTYTALGTYEVTLEVFNGCSCSTRYSLFVTTIKSSVSIDCPSVVCEGNHAVYSVDPSLGDTCPHLHWNIVGGHVVSHNATNTQIDVLWDAVDADGFGYVSVVTPTCSHCSTPEKIPVIKQQGTIVGNSKMCPKTQSTYFLPQWPSTDFHWSLNDGGTGASLLFNNNRNEIIVQSISNGTLELTCDYFNTLLGCGGSAHFTIQVKPFARLSDPHLACKNVTTAYQILDDTNTVINDVNWSLEGPNSYSITGTTGTFNVSFPETGTYTFSINDDFYCSTMTSIIVKDSPAAPTSITGSLLVCPGIPVTYTCAPLEGSIAHWSVNSTDGSILGSATGNQVTINFNALPDTLTSYTVEVWYEGELCNSPHYFQIVNRDVPVFDIISNNATVCGSTEDGYHTNYLSGETYVWSVVPNTAGSIKTGQNTSNVSILWNQPSSGGLANVKLEIRKCGVVYTKLYPVTIINHPNITVSAPATNCVGTPITASFNMSIGNSFDYVVWDFGNGATITNHFNDPNVTNPFSVTYNYINTLTSNTNYTITATVYGANGCISTAIGSSQIVLYPSPIVSLNYPELNNICGFENSGNPMFDCSVDIQSGFGYTYTIQWYKDGSPITGAQSATLNVSNLINGSFIGTYYAVVTSSNLCSSSTLSFTIYEDCSNDPPPNGGGFTQCNCTVNLNTSYTCQGATIDVVSSSCPISSTSWSFNNLPQLATITQNGNYHYSITNVYPGKYQVNSIFHFSTGGTGGGSCTVNRSTNIIIPYMAGIKYHVECTGNGLYTVQLIDHSVFYPLVGISHYEFTTDGGAHWTLMSAGVTQNTYSLAPGPYTIGVRISTSGYTACTAFTQLVLPALPDATFQFDQACIGSAVHFTPLHPQLGSQYIWNFWDGSVNLQEQPVKTFTSSNNFLVTLTVINEYGCVSDTWGTFVNVPELKLSGDFVLNPTIACEGASVLLTYQPSLQQIMPAQITWYHDTVTATPFAITNSTMPNFNSIPVTQSGQYFVYVQDGNGCNYYLNKAVTVPFIPLPVTPVVKGTSIACVGSAINLSIPHDASLHYEWSVNGVVNPSWNNLTQITDFQTVAGTYTYGVVAQVTNPSGGSCASPMGTYTVTVVANPDVPELSYSIESCDPYSVRVIVTNPQNGVNYYWSNGYTGLETLITHDGPIEVRAEVFDCSVTAQIDLPRDLTALAWTFPKGCYTECSTHPLGYLIGPMGLFTSWSWLTDNHITTSGTGTLDSFNNLAPGHTYELQLGSDTCNVLLSEITVSDTKCVQCNLEYIVKEVHCVNVDGINLYAVTINFQNGYSSPLTLNLSVPSGAGYFETNSLQLPTGFSSQTFLFHSLNGFSGGSVFIALEGHYENSTCYREVKIDFPDSCDAVGCDFQYTVGTVNCLSTSNGTIYDVTLTITNPYAVAASTSLSLQNGQGYFAPNSLTLLPGTHDYHLSFYPLNGFQGGYVGIDVDTGFNAFHCLKQLKILFPDLCHPADSCNLDLTINAPQCNSLGNHYYVYQISMAVYNPYGVPVTVSLSAPNGEGYFTPNVLVLPNLSSVQSFNFYTSNPFYGGDIIIGFLAHWNTKTCYTEQKIHFETCCFSCKLVDLDDPKVTSDDLLVVAPNPAQENTTIFYNFVSTSALKSIELNDLLGRTLQVWNVETAKGAIDVDVSHFAQGNYMVLMKEDGKIIKSTKLITN